MHLNCYEILKKTTIRNHVHQLDNPGMTVKQIITSPFKLIQANFLLVCTAISLAAGWANRDNNYLSAETGAGYVLGIIGGCMMLVLLLYPLSKRVSLLTRLLPLRYWFGLHMLLGTVGPVLILFHSNFHSGSANSTTALVCMIFVATSGVAGRYIYTRIHHGLYGARINLQEMQRDIENRHAELLNMHGNDEQLGLKLKQMEEKVLTPYTSLATSFHHVIDLAVKSSQVNNCINELYQYNKGAGDKNMINHEDMNAQNMVKNYTLALRRTAALRVYERLFSLWHILHLPLFFMMIITAVIHIFAVHMY